MVLFFFRVSPLLLFAFLFSGPPHAFAAEPAPDKREKRLYREGPLTAADFAARPPVPNRADPDSVYQAHIHSEITYTYKAQHRMKDGVATATLTAFQAEAKVNRGRSWNRRPEDAELLDHEQGHFDISFVLAEDWRLRTNDRIAKGTADFTQAKSVEAAAAELDRVLEKQLAELLKVLAAENAAYDDQTSHGLKLKRQAEFRAVQKRQVKLYEERAAGKR